MYALACLADIISHERDILLQEHYQLSFSKKTPILTAMKYIITGILTVLIQKNCSYTNSLLIYSGK
jgi:hypothetical protein